MIKSKKKVSSCLAFMFCAFSVLPVQAGYYKTIYVQDEPVKETVVIRETVENPQNTVIIHENNYVTDTVYTNPIVLAATGISAFVGGMALGAITHSHHHSPHRVLITPHHHNNRHVYHR